jgi:nicotinamidase-related amidase
MAKLKFEKTEITALLVIDPYNDLISEGGKFWDHLKTVAEANNCVPNAGKIVILEHWGSSGFANTDLDLQLKNHGIHQLMVMGLIAHTCNSMSHRRTYGNDSSSGRNYEGGTSFQSRS